MEVFMVCSFGGWVIVIEFLFVRRFGNFMVFVWLIVMYWGLKLLIFFSFLNRMVLLGWVYIGFFRKWLNFFDGSLGYIFLYCFLVMIFGSCVGKGFLYWWNLRFGMIFMKRKIIGRIINSCLMDKEIRKKRLVELNWILLWWMLCKIN